MFNKTESHLSSSLAGIVETVSCFSKSYFSGSCSNVLSADWDKIFQCEEIRKFAQHLNLLSNFAGVKSASYATQH